MERDNLEKFIQKSRGEFDTQEVPSGIWERISGELDTRQAKQISLLRMVGVAAATVVILGVGVIMGLQLGSDNYPSGSQMNEFTQAESYYAKQFNVRWSEFQELNVEDNSIEKDLEQLDAIYNELKGELLQNPDLNTKKVVNALIGNYQTKIDILETVLEKTKKQNLTNLKTQSHELDEI